MHQSFCKWTFSENVHSQIFCQFPPFFISKEILRRRMKDIRSGRYIKGENYTSVFLPLLSPDKIYQFLVASVKSVKLSEVESRLGGDTVN